MKYFYADAKNDPQGPYELTQIEQLLAAGTLTDATSVIPENGTEWKPLSHVLALAKLPPPPPLLSTTPPVHAHPKHQMSIPHPPSQPSVAAVRTSAAAIWGLVLGIGVYISKTGYFLIGIPPFGTADVLAVASIICGLVSRKHIRKSQGRLKGGGMALAAIILGLVPMIFSLVIAAILVVKAVRTQPVAP